MAAPPTNWLELTYEPVGPFSLRPSYSTSAGGKTLIVPTPYAVKLAFVDAEIRRSGPAAGDAMFSLVKPASIGLLPAPRICVTKTFVRSLKKSRGETDDEDDGPEEKIAGPAPTFGSTLRYRELCLMSGPLIVSIGLRSEPTDVLVHAARAINYFGARGGFFQLVDLRWAREIDGRCTVVDPLGWSPPQSPVGELACLLDDLGPEATLSRVSPFSAEGARWRADRTATMALLAVRRVASGPHWTFYERLGG